MVARRAMWASRMDVESLIVERGVARVASEAFSVQRVAATISTL